MSEPPEVDFLATEDLLVIIEGTLGSRHVVRDFGLLDSAAARPRASLYGDDAYPGLAGKAAALLLSLVGHHPLVDGNKRLGLAALFVFHELNGLRLDATDDELFDLIMFVAEGSATEVEKIAETLRGWEAPLD